MKCNRCGREIAEDETYSHKGQALCEDCYIDVISPDKECDPWGTYLSTRERQSAGVKGKGGLSEIQTKIYELVRSQGGVTREEVMTKLGLSVSALELQLRVLMHAELVKERSEGSTMYLIPVPVNR
jgi:hypothetical protein